MNARLPNLFARAARYVSGNVRDPGRWINAAEWAFIGTLAGVFAVRAVNGHGHWPDRAQFHAIGYVVAAGFMLAVTGLDDVLFAPAIASTDWAVRSPRRAGTLTAATFAAVFTAASIFGDRSGSWFSVAVAAVVAVGLGAITALCVVLARPKPGWAEIADQWAEPTTLRGLGEVMARWLEGDLPWAPGYGGGPDEETTGLIPVLAALNRAGLVTHQSQPAYERRPEGDPEYDHDGVAAVWGFADRVTLAWLQQAVAGTGLVLLYGTAPRWRTRRQDLNVLFSRRYLLDMYDLFSDGVITDLRAAYQVCIYDPDCDRADLLWDTLSAAPQVRAAAAGQAR
jgi:hypothetical protein